MLQNRNEDNDDQQGFIKAKQQFFIAYKFASYSTPRNLRCSQFSKKLKSIKLKIQSIQNIKTSPFINHSVRENTFNKVIKQRRQNIIFNGFNNQVGQAEPNITFDANFPMGNLEVVTKLKNSNYEIFMRPDTNTNTHFQWFYFRVNIVKKKRVRFMIKNFIKATMLYSKGLKPFYLSKKQGNTNFKPISQEVQFKEDFQSDFFNLTFVFDFGHDNDEVYFSSQPPYGYQKLQRTLAQVRNSKQFVIGKTILGNKIPYLIFNKQSQAKVIGIAIARQHPGQAVGSWMMQGFLRTIEKLQFPSEIQWIIIPMVNIDGVQLGNNRTGILGHDFNRNWDIDQGSKKEKMFPEISSILNYVRKLKKKYPKKVKMFLDFHGHSSEQNVFTYGPEHIEKTDYFYMSRLFPDLIAKKNHNFKTSQSSYKINNDKKNAARSIILNHLKLPFTYTIECTFGVMNDKPVCEDEIIKVGEDIARAANQFLEYLFIKESQHHGKKMVEEIKEKHRQMKYEADEYDSASEASQYSPDRKQFQQNIQSLLQEKSSKKTSLIKFNIDQNSSKVQLIKGRRKNSQETFAVRSKDLNSDDLLKSLTNSKNKKRGSRLATEGSIPQIYNECAYFPPLRKQSNYIKTSIPERFHSLSKDTTNVPEIMNMKEIQQRLFKMKNSRIGKKILVINAYGV